MSNFNAAPARPFATPLQYAIFYFGRMVAFCFRLRSLDVAHAVFGWVNSPTLVKRRFYDRTLVLDVARASPQKLLWLQGRRFIQERALLEALVRPGMYVVDVGANIGYCTMLFSSLTGERGRIWSIEPDPVNLLELEATVAENRLAGQVTVLPVAAGASEGTVKFEPGLNSCVTPEGRSEVPVKSLDSLKLDRVDLVKIDVEGYEGAVLEGAQATLARCQPSIFMELHPRLLTGHTHAGILDLVQRHYPHVQAYRIERRSFLIRLLQSYGLCGYVSEIRDVRSVVEGFQTGRLVEPCWIVGTHNPWWPGLSQPRLPRAGGIRAGLSHQP